MYLLAPFILQNFKEILRANPELRGCAIFRPKMAHLSWTIFFGINHYYFFHLSIGTFHCAKFKLLQRILSYEDAPVLGPKWSTCPKQFFCWKIINIILVYLLAPFTVQKKFPKNSSSITSISKNSSSITRVMRMCNFWTQNGHFPKLEFFRKPVNELCFFHPGLSTCQIVRSQILIY